jgi:hypothetical protein
VELVRKMAVLIPAVIASFFYWDSRIIFKIIKDEGIIDGTPITYNINLNIREIDHHYFDFL